MNEIFSGGFGSRVVQNVRTKLGLAYSVGGSFGASYDHPGIFYVIAGTKSAIDRRRNQGHARRDRPPQDPVPPTPAELRKAKDQLLNSFIFHYDSPDKTLNEQVTLAFYGYPLRLPREVQRPASKRSPPPTSPASPTNTSTSRSWRSSSSATSPRSSRRSQRLGKVTTLDITIPPPPAPAGKPVE